MSIVRRDGVYPSGPCSIGWDHADTSRPALLYLPGQFLTVSGNQVIILVYSPDYVHLLIGISASRVNVRHWLDPCLELQRCCKITSSLHFWFLQMLEAVLPFMRDVFRLMVCRFKSRPSMLAFRILSQRPLCTNAISMPSKLTGSQTTPAH